MCSYEGEFDIAFNLHRILDELIEWAREPSSDEWSDVMINISCALHAIWPSWHWLLPGAGRSMDKGIRRFAEHGCCRSLRNACTKKEGGL